MKLYAGGRPVTILDRLADPVMRRAYNARAGHPDDGRGLVAKDPAGAGSPNPWVGRTPDGAVRWFTTWDEAYAWARTGSHGQAARLPVVAMPQRCGWERGLCSGCAACGDGSVEGPRLAVDPMRESAARVKTELEKLDRIERAAAASRRKVLGLTSVVMAKDLE